VPLQLRLNVIRLKLAQQGGERTTFRASLAFLFAGFVNFQVADVVVH
jgi:hypothetical protein